ncbi:hypothetical protein FACS189430_12290 [Bacteroidia bacterium]|nr:hypothetical protein FACS189430_12290 [Bacteroidia bacterium]
MFCGCSKDEPDEPAYEHFVSIQSGSPYSKDFLPTALASQGYGEYAALPTSDVQAYRMVYTTSYPKGTKLNASGTMFVPKEYDQSFPTLIFHHGTNEERESAAVLTLTETYFCVTLSSAFHCVVLAPDYIGYGESKSVVHPYNHSESLGQSGLDFLLACKEYTRAPQVDLTFNPNIFITGYSEGGYAAVALQKTIDERPSAGLNVAKTVAGTGAYDLVAFSKELVAYQNPLDAKVIASYLWMLEMYKTDHQYTKNYADIFSESDNNLLKTLNYQFAYFNTEKLNINLAPTQLLSSQFREDILNDRDAEFRAISGKNSFTDFVPRDSLIFVYGDKDRWVFPVNTENTYRAMLAKGGKVKAYLQKGGDHASTIDLYIQVVLSRCKMYLKNEPKTK